MVDEVKEVAEVIEAKMTWWQKNVDEMVVGIIIGLVAIAALYLLKDIEGGGVAVATSAVTGLSVYLKKDKSGNGE